VEKIDAHSDLELFLLVKQDDCNAFTEIYHKYWQELFNTAFKRNHNREQCQDIVQNIFTDLWNRRKVLTIIDLEAFLHTAVRYQVFKQAEKKPFQSVFLDCFEEIIISPVHTDDLLLEKEILELIQKWIAALPAKRRKIFLLHYLEDLSTKEISEYIGISRKTTQNQLTTASQSLRLRLAQVLSLSLLITIIVKYLESNNI